MKELKRKIFVVFSLTSIIPFLVFAYLTLPHLLPRVTYTSSIPVIILITIFILILGFFLLWRMDNNIAKLSTSANIIAKGGLVSEVQVKDTDEMGDLANSLNQITQRLRQDMNALETHAILVERANKELDKLNKLKSEFVSIVSHELRAPLINIKQAASLVLNKLSGQMDLEAERCLAIVDRNTQRLLRLISDLLDVSKIEAGKLKLNPDMIDIGKLICEATESLERWRELKKIKLKIEIESDLPNIYVDSDRINQILVNLLSNAIKFTPVAGEITLKAGMGKKREFLEISVQDTGVGIPADQLDKIFDRFKQISRSSSTDVQGIGLGLSITKEIVKMHSGQIWVESKPGQGSKFIFTLPVKERKERSRKNIMVVDDEYVVVETLRELLVKVGYTNLTEAYDGDEALQKLKTLIPDLLILDMKMPKMSGYEIIRRLKEDGRTKQIPILIISGYNVETDRLREYIPETDIPIVSKPIDIEQLKRWVNCLVDRSLS